MKPDIISATAAVVVPVVGVLWYLIRREIRVNILEYKLQVERRFAGIEKRLARIDGETEAARRIG